MKVYELISKLMEAKAGDEVVIVVANTLTGEIQSVYLEDGLATITGGDVELIDDKGISKGYLSHWTEPEEGDDE